MSSFTCPEAERLLLVERLHGRDVPDPYRWLEDAADPRTVAWEAAQEELLARARRGGPATAAFTTRLTELLGAGDVSTPGWRGERRGLAPPPPEAGAAGAPGGGARRHRRGARRP